MSDITYALPCGRVVGYEELLSNDGILQLVEDLAEHEIVELTDPSDERTRAWAFTAIVITRQHAPGGYNVQVQVRKE